MTESLELLHEDVFEVKIATSPVWASSVELLDDQHEDCYVAQAAILPSCLVPDLLRCARHPLAAWRLLRAQAAKLGLTKQCGAGLWRLLRALSSSEHREESCVTLGLLNGDAHFVGTRRGVLEAILPALASAPTPSAPLLVADPLGTSTLAAAITAATRPAVLKVKTVEEKWPHSYRRLLLLAGVPDVDALHLFWHDYADQKKAQRVQSVALAMAGSLGLESPTIVAKMIDMLDSLVLAGVSEDSLNEGLTIWQFPALAPADTDSVNESLRSWEGLLTGNTAMSLADVKEIIRVGKVGVPKSWLHVCAQLEHWTVVMALLLRAGHDAVAWLLSLARLARTWALVFDRQAPADPQLPLAVLARIHLSFHAFFESVQGGGPAKAGPLHHCPGTPRAALGMPPATSGDASSPGTCVRPEHSVGPLGRLQ
jgi:hypothetical protein